MELALRTCCWRTRIYVGNEFDARVRGRLGIEKEEEEEEEGGSTC